MKRQKHYDSEEAILKKIDGQRERARSLNTQAELLESLSVEHAKTSWEMFQLWEDKTGKAAKDGLDESNRLKHESEKSKDEAIKCRKKARRIEETTLPALGESLSEFRTAPMIPITGDNLSVVGPVASL